MRFQMVTRTGHPGFLDLPWNLPLEEWSSARPAEVARGLHRHVVRFVPGEQLVLSAVDEADLPLEV